MVHLLESALHGQKLLKHLHMTPTGAAMPWSSWFTVYVLLLMPEEVWSFKLAERWRLLHTLQLRGLCGLTLWGWAAVVHKHFHFVILSLTADRGIYKREEMSQTDLLPRWHPIAASHSASSLARPVLSRVLVKTDCMPVAKGLKTPAFKDGAG